MYKTPSEYYLRLHFERSRFSRKLEDMLLLLAAKITNLGVMEKDKFDALLDGVIKETNGGEFTEKTIRNQRTEMIRLFGLVKYKDGVAIPGTRLTTLSQSQDIPRFFKDFCKNFQYPGGFLKPDRVSEMVIAGVKFKPAKYLLKLLKTAESRHGTFAISAAEATHFIFNDKRVTVDDENPTAVLDRIIDVRTKKIPLDKTGDVIRYARDFMNYMVQANLLDELKGMYRLNKGEEAAIHALITDKTFFDGYSKVINPNGTWDKNEYKEVDARWMEWFADTVGGSDLDTPISALIKDRVDLPDEWKKVREMLVKKDTSVRRGYLKELGDEGQQIALQYEKDAVAKVRSDLVHLVKDVSVNGALGYDIISLHPLQERRKKYIEVKTTKKNYESDVAIPFTMSINEWSVAGQSGDDYFVYRVIITREGVKIFSIQNPHLRQKEGSLQIEPVAYKVVYTSQAGAILN